MTSFREDRLEHLTLPMSSVWLLSDIAEAKGKQELFSRQTPQVLEALRQMALVQSVESSNRIEGVVVEPGRLHPLVIGDATPRDRSEEEIRNYRDALELIHSRYRDLGITPELFQRLHGIVQKGSGDAGQWKAADNEIIEMSEAGLPHVRFRPVSAAETPAAVQELCDAYRQTLDGGTIPPLLAVAGLVLDFLCIHTKSPLGSPEGGKGGEPGARPRCPMAEGRPEGVTKECNRR